jgi:hypothetical protein
MMSFPFHKKNLPPFCAAVGPDLPPRDLAPTPVAIGGCLLLATLRATAVVFGGYGCCHLDWRKSKMPFETAVTGPAEMSFETAVTGPAAI